MADHLYVDVHILQTVPPSNLNRDDAGSPKQAQYGGTRRARVSSQAWKRATRLAFADQMPSEDLATRTKRMTGMLAHELGERCELGAERSQRLASAVLAPLGIKPAQKKEQETSYLLFFGRRQLAAIADLAAARAEELDGLPDDELKEAAKQLPVRETLSEGHPLDVALFGRMVADIPALNVDAATQVAHALSTHAAETQFDYYTAVDDENTDAETGAGMIGTVEFNSATLYRYATVGVHQLLDNLGDRDATADTVRLFLDAFARSMPTGHQNSFAHRTLPSCVVASLRTDQPVNLVEAFEKPVLSSPGGYAEESAKRLAVEYAGLGEVWSLPAARTVATYIPADSVADKLTETFGPSVAFPELLDTVRAGVRSWLDTGEVA